MNTTKFFPSDLGWQRRPEFDLPGATGWLRPEGMIWRLPEGTTLIFEDGRPADTANAT